MEALYFGPSESYLFGVFHPRQGTNRNEAIVLCNPFGQEYLRAHKSIRRLAISLAQLGYSVLRFDYRGTGDSMGDLSGVTADQWVEDVGHAIQELRDMTAAPEISLVGLRLGALVAAKAAIEQPRISRLVMWDPVLNGLDYVEGIRASVKDAQLLGSRSRLMSADGTLHFNGFSMPTAFQQSVSEWNLSELLSRADMPIAQIVSHESDGFADLNRQLSGRPEFYAELAPAPHDWNYVDHVGGILWPKPVIDAIEHYFTQPTHQEKENHA